MAVACGRGDQRGLLRRHFREAPQNLRAPRLSWIQFQIVNVEVIAETKGGRLEMKHGRGASESQMGPGAERSTGVRKGETSSGGETVKALHPEELFRMGSN